MNLDKEKQIKKIEGSILKNQSDEPNNNFFNRFRSNLSLKKTVTLSVIVASFICSIIGISKISTSNKASASITKNSIANSQVALNTITHNGQTMYMANATFYDYYSDSQIGTSSAPKGITDALDGSKNTFSKFNNKLMNIMKYNDPDKCPAKYPMFQGRPGALADMDGICYPKKNDLYEKNNYWAAANWGQVSSVATQGLVDNTLMFDSNGKSYLTQSNPTNKKSAKVPFFDEEFLTKNTYDNSSLTLGSVKKNVAFPFRRVEKNNITYYEFYSSKDTIRLNNQDQLDYLGYNNSSEQVKDAEGNFGFFPYNKASEGKSNKLNFGHGVKIEIPFNMTKNGKIDGKDMVFEFSGDDDVWVFIDGFLALDIGGNHGEVEGNINFSTCESMVSKVKNNKVAFSSRTLSSFNVGNNTFSDLGISDAVGVYNNFKTPFSSELKTALKNTSKTHTLTLFYMERGLNVANMKMSFNLPEPTVLNVSNTLNFDDVGKTFKQETSNVASNDAFIYDALDKTISRRDEFELYNNEAITFSNEFDKNDHLLVQQKALKIATRKLTTLYSTKWTLNDISNEITKGNDLLVTDSRSSTKNSFLFANKNDDKVPVLTANYINSPKTGNFELKCTVDDSYIKKNKEYKNTSFTYIIKHSNIFGGNSKSTYYKGEYTLYNSSNNKETASTTNGKINLKPNEKIIIENIPVTTKLEVIVILNSNTYINSIESTSNFKANIDSKSTNGTINDTSNIVIYTLTNKKDKEEIITIPTDNVPNKQDPLNKLEDINESDDFDDNPSTGDDSHIGLWVAFAIISILTCIISFIYLLKQEQKNIKH